MKLKFTEQVRIANLLLTALSDVATGKAAQTIGLIKKAGLDPSPTGDRNNCRTILKKLAAAGVVHKQGVGSFYWALKVKTWDVANPFKKIDGTSPAPASSSSGSYPITGATYNYREQLRALGCRWDKDSKSWNAPNSTVQAQGQALVNGEGAPDDGAATSTPSGISIAGMQATIDQLTKQVEQLKEDAKSNGGGKYLKIVVGTAEKTLATITDKVLPSTFRDVLDLASVRENILLVGPAGCGKTHLGGLVAEALGLEFASVSCTSGMTEVHLLGKSTPNLTTGKNEFQGTEFLRMYENGGVFLLDEIDAADPNLLLALNSGLANGYLNVPNRPKKPRAEMHSDFVCIATANTFGRGANRSYAGRNPLDEATLDRFRMGTIECDYEKSIEFVLCPDDTLRHRLQEIRAKIETAGLRRIVSTRFLKSAYKMMKSCDWTIDKIVERLTSGWSADEKSKIL